MQKHLAAGLLALLIGAFNGAPAQAQQACDSYQVVRGDTLRNIARTAFGAPDYTEIYRKNSQTIGRNPNVLRIGLVLDIPCAPGNLAFVGAQVPGGQRGNGLPVLSLATANGFAPYTDEALQDRGLITQLVAMAMLRGDPGRDAEVVFVNDWAAHLETLLPRAAFDASFPWSKPACDGPEALSASQQYACENFVYSRPLYQSVEGFFAQAGSGYEDADSFDLLQGASVCRPEGMSVDHLARAGLMPPNVELLRPVSAQRCFGLLANGQVDVVAIDTRAGDVQARQLNMEFLAVENPFLQMIEPLYVVAHKDNARGAKTLEILNTGLDQMQASGEWDSVVTQGLRQQAEVVMN